MLNRLLSYLGFCRHQHIGWPQGKERVFIQVQCHDCRKRFVYDWQRMKIGYPKSRCADVIAQVESEAGS